MSIITAGDLSNLSNQSPFRANGSTVTLKKISETDWILFGDLAEGDSEGFPNIVRPLSVYTFYNNRYYTLPEFNAEFGMAIEYSANDNWLEIGNTGGSAALNNIIIGPHAGERGSFTVDRISSSGPNWNYVREGTEIPGTPDSLGNVVLGTDYQIEDNTYLMVGASYPSDRLTDLRMISESGFDFNAPKNPSWP